MFKDTESTLYYIGICVGIFVAAVYLLVDMLCDRYGIIVPKMCVFRMLTGLYCPGCGGTRSILALLHGNVIKSFIYNPFVLYSFIITFIFYISQTASRLTHGLIKGLRIRKSYIYAGIILLVANFAVKNFCLVVLGIRLIE